MTLDDETISALGYARADHLGLPVPTGFDTNLWPVPKRAPKPRRDRTPAKVIPPDEQRARWRAAKAKQRANPAYLAAELARDQEVRPRKGRAPKLTLEERTERRRLWDRKRRAEMTDAEREAKRVGDRERVRRAREKAGLEAVRAQNRKDQRAHRAYLVARAIVAARAA